LTYSDVNKVANFA